MKIEKPTLDFLKEIRVNNNREWFEPNKDWYKKSFENVKEVAKVIGDELSHHDEVEPAKVFRIYRDVRFSKDKTPFKNSFSFGFQRATKARRGGYYIGLEPGASMLGAGFWGPESKDLKRIRTEFAADGDSMRKILADPDFIETFGELQGEKVKSAPRGFPKDHPNIDLLRYKQYLVYRSFTDKEVMSKDFPKLVSDTFQKLRPFLDYMSDVLTTDENGVPIE